VRRAAALPLTLGLLLAIAPAADALSLRASSPEPGRIALRVVSTPGAALTVTDELTGAQRALTGTQKPIVLRRFATWSCDSTIRRFSVRQDYPDGSNVVTGDEVQTPSCAHRLVLEGAGRVRAARTAVLRLRDRWRLGDWGARLCVTPPGAHVRCRKGSLGPGQHKRALRVRVLRAGSYRVTATNRYQRLRRTLRARPPGGRLQILATGDSMIQIVDSFMRERARPARLRSDARVSTGISKPSLLDWRKHAREQVAGIRPDVIVMFLGANDGFPMAGADCCGMPWIAEYARRAREMMRTYARGGRARVYWLLLPAARGGVFRETFPAVNAALRLAADGLEDDVRLIELDEVFTPGGRYRKSMKIGGKRVRVRQSDGVHLNTTGAELAARLVVEAIRRDRMLR
jgi:lysophospholipase L1-like esterase